MQWSADRNGGFSRANPQRLYLPLIVDPEYHYETVNVEAQQANPSSLLWWTKRLIALRKRFQAFSRGSIEFLFPENRKVLAFIRRYEDQCILVVANLSRLVQYANLDLSAFHGSVPIELFGRTPFPRVTDQRYFVTLGPHAFYWFELKPVEARPGLTARQERAHRPVLRAAADLDALLAGAARAEIEAALPDFLVAQRWFQGKARTLRNTAIRDLLPLTYDDQRFYLALVDVEYIEEEAETYTLPLGLATPSDTDRLLRRMPAAAIADTTIDERPMVLYDASASADFRAALFALTGTRRRARGERGEIVPQTLSDVRGATPADNRLLGVEQSNTSIVYGNVHVLKLYRRLEEGTGLDLEIGRFLTGANYPNTPRVTGALDYRDGESDKARTLAVLQDFVPNEGDAWALTVDAVGEYLERAAAMAGAPPDGRFPGTRALLDAAAAGPSDDARAAVGAYIEEIRLLGQRTGELHLALAGDPDNADFAPEPFTVYYQRSVYQSMRNLAGRVLQQLRSGLDLLPERLHDDARALLGMEQQLRGRFKRMIEQKIAARRTRVHGDYHLGQVLFTGKDFQITDFEGEPIRPLSERRLKRSPLRDVAGMLRSFHYAIYAALVDQEEGGGVRDMDRPGIEPWANFWYASVGATFLGAYLDAARPGGFLPADDDQLAMMLDSYLLEKAVYELGYELNNRPDWAFIPLRGLLQLMHE
jgi:maltose alpha-D-glucosyltransferase / alpha-amylase